MAAKATKKVKPETAPKAEKVKKKRKKKNRNGQVMICVGAVGMLVCFLFWLSIFFQAQASETVMTADQTAQVTMFGVLMVIFMLILAIGVIRLINAGFRRVSESSIEEDIQEKMEKLETDLLKLNQATFMRIKKINEETQQLLDRAGMTKEEMVQANQLLSDEIAKRQMCIANIQIKRNVENTDALLNSNDKILGSFGDMVEQMGGIAEASANAAASAAASVAERVAAEAHMAEPMTMDMDFTEEAPAAGAALIPEDSIEIMADAAESMDIPDMAAMEEFTEGLMEELAMPAMDEIAPGFEMPFVDDTPEDNTEDPAFSFDLPLGEDPNRPLTEEEIAALFNSI